MLREQGVDAAVLQEAKPPPPGIAFQTVPPTDGDWTTSGAKRNFCAAIATLNSDVSLKPLPMRPRFR